jgi:hypothetical protein
MSQAGGAGKNCHVFKRLLDFESVILGGSNPVGWMAWNAAIKLSLPVILPFVRNEKRGVH